MAARATTTLLRLRAQLQGALFLPAPAGRSRLSRTEVAVLVVALLGLGTILQMLRIGPSEALDSLWAEDGVIFLQGALGQGFWDAVVQPYSGYLVLVPRLIGEVAAAVPLRDAAAATSVSAGLVVALSGLVVWFAAAGLIRDPYLRGGLVAATVLSPVAGLESVAAAAYVLWYMLFASFWLLLWRPASTRGAVLGGLFLLATGLSTPGVWFFAPVAALRALAARDRRDLALLGGYAAGAAVQVPVLAANSGETVEPLWSADIWTAYLQRVLDAGAFGERLGGEAWELLGWPFLIALGVGAIAGLGFAAWRAGAAARWFAAIAIPTSLLMFVVSTYQRAVGTQMKWPPDIHFGNSGRYAIVPVLLLLSAALVLVDRRPRPARRSGRLPWAVAITTAVLALAVASSFDVSEPAVRGTPAWSDALDSAARTCAAENPEVIAVPTSPPGFGLTLSCESVAAASDAGAAR
ncbi:MAG TPA: hypothetical protein VFX45_09035 [Solirubrobacterales bacterium]|nr:hypothetical protein [Solirubrobacterales bacterium]